MFRRSCLPMPASNRTFTRGGSMGATGESKPVVVQPGSSASRVEQPSTPDPEVVEKAKRRKFTAEYKLRIVREAELCNPGELGALLRREGLYLSNLTCWHTVFPPGFGLCHGHSLPLNGE